MLGGGEKPSERHIDSNKKACQQMSRRIETAWLVTPGVNWASLTEEIPLCYFLQLRVHPQ